MKKLWEKLVEYGIDWLEKIVEGIKACVIFFYVFNRVGLEMLMEAIDG